MLYRQPRPFRFIPATFARILGFTAELRRTIADEAYLDTLNEHALRDIGIGRIAARDDCFYR